MNKATSLKIACILFVFCAATAIAAPAQMLTTLHNFAGGPSDGATPLATLVQGSDGNFYGTTYGGGANGDGTVFKITPSGTLTTLYNFCSQSNCSDGEEPEGGLVQATDGNFYGTAEHGGANGDGTVFKITPSGTLTTLYNFAGSDGSLPGAGLVQATDGNFYGTTRYGGAYSSGTVFKITPSGALTTLYSFCLYECLDGRQPFAALVQGTDGNFYGTTVQGGNIEGDGDCEEFGCGTVFKITPSGTLTSLYQFSQSDGAYPQAGLVQGTDGNFYGTTYYGGAYGCSGQGCGTVFKITPSGVLTTLHNFAGVPSDGAYPNAGLVQASDGNFYGTASAGGAYTSCFDGGCGTVFKITPSGTLTTLYNFAGSDGGNPFAGLVQGLPGTFYGTTANGGANNEGTVFRLTLVRECTVCPNP